MKSWYKVKVKYTKELEDGTLSRVTEPYLVNAVSHTNAEAIIHEDVGQYVRGEFIVSSITPVVIQDIFMYDDSTKLVKAKVSYITENIDTGREQKSVHYFYVSADNLKEAFDRLTEQFRGAMVNYQIETLSHDNIQDVILYKSTEEE